ncbi:MAG: hypothetical protein LUE11_07555 [Clostridia bacterium]|nr:hypothetical protein [Clostridia bacterium]
MAATLIAFIITLLILFVIGFGLWYFERMFAKKNGKYSGILMPILFFALSVVAIVQSAPTTFSQLQAQGYGIGASAATLVFSFILTNIPTFWVYFVYRRTRKRLGLKAWPFGKGSADSNDKNSQNSK